MELSAEVENVPLPARDLWYDSNMMQSIKRVIPKKRGRPATGNDPIRSFRMPDDLMARVDAWSANQGDRPSRAEAMRRLVEIGLGRSKSTGPAAAKTAERLKRLAAKTIDRLADPAASIEEAASRKQRLLKGPEEFRNIRVDGQEKT